MKFFKKTQLTAEETAVTEFEYLMRKAFATHGGPVFKIEQAGDILTVTVTKPADAYYFMLNHYTISETIVKSANESGLSKVYADLGNKYAMDGWAWVFERRGDGSEEG